MDKVLMKGNEAIAEAAILCGCRFFFGYPITPQNQIPEYMSRRMPKEGGCFLQAESEVAAINMVYGAAAAGARVMTSSSSPGISLKQEGISYLVGAELPCVIVNIVRGGPGLGSIQPGQSDYFQATRGGGHGDYRMPVYAPATLQEAVELTQKAFDMADYYRNPAMILGDGILGQMMEPVKLDKVAPDRELPDKAWATVGWDGKSRPRSVINSLYMDPAMLEKHNEKLQAKYKAMEQDDTMCETDGVEDASIVIVAYGTTARIARSAMKQARAEGIKVGMIRPITVWPFPKAEIEAASKNPKTHTLLVVEMSAGQLVEDVQLYSAQRKPVEFIGRMGGMIPTVREIYEKLIALKEGQ